MQLISSLAVLATTIAAVKAQGNAWVYNHCTHPVYLWAVDTERNPSAPVVVAPGGSWSEVYHTPASGGVSVKVSKTPSQALITQFEYTLTGGDYNMIWYDGSNINCVDAGCPFDNENLYVGATVASCPQVYCGANETPCGGFYNTPDENLATHACHPTSDVFMHICLPSGQMPGAPPSPASSSSSVVQAPSSAPQKAAVANKVPMEALAVGTTTLVRRVAEPTAAAPQGIAAHAHARRHMHAHKH